MMFLLYAIFAAALIVVDQLTKHWAVTALAQGSIPLVEDVFEFKFHKNPGVAFSMLEGKRWLFIPISLLMTVLLIVIFIRSPLRKSKFFSISVVLVISGAVGNLIDRIALGYVVDFFYVKLINFPIFNFADCCVVIGVCLLFGYLILGMRNIGDMPMRTLLFGIHDKTKESDHG